MISPTAVAEAARLAAYENFERGVATDRAADGTGGRALSAALAALVRSPSVNALSVCANLGAALRAFTVVGDGYLSTWTTWMRARGLGILAIAPAVVTLGSKNHAAVRAHVGGP